MASGVSSKKPFLAEKSTHGLWIPPTLARQPARVKGSYGSRRADWIALMLLQVRNEVLSPPDLACEERPPWVGHIGKEDAHAWSFDVRRV